MVEIRINLGGLNVVSHQRLTNIPPSVRQGHHAAVRPGAKPAGISTTRGRGRSNLLIEQVLQQGQVKEKEIIAMLNQLMEAGVRAGDMLEFDRLNEQLGQVQETIKKALGKLGS